MYHFIEAEPITYYNNYSGVDIDNYVNSLEADQIEYHVSKEYHVLITDTEPKEFNIKVKIS